MGCSFKFFFLVFSSPMCSSSFFFCSSFPYSSWNFIFFFCFTAPLLFVFELYGCFCSLCCCAVLFVVCRRCIQPAYTRSHIGSRVLTHTQINVLLIFLKQEKKQQQKAGETYWSSSYFFSETVGNVAGMRSSHCSHFLSQMVASSARYSSLSRRRFDDVVLLFFTPLHPRVHGLSLRDALVWQRCICGKDVLLQGKKWRLLRSGGAPVCL